MLSSQHSDKSRAKQFRHLNDGIVIWSLLVGSLFRVSCLVRSCRILPLAEGNQPGREELSCSASCSEHLAGEACIMETFKHVGIHIYMYSYMSAYIFIQVFAGMGYAIIIHSGIKHCLPIYPSMMLSLCRTAQSDALWAEIPHVQWESPMAWSSIREDASLGGRSFQLCRKGFVEAQLSLQNALALGGIWVQICWLACWGDDACRAVPNPLVKGAENLCGAPWFYFGWFQWQVKLLGCIKMNSQWTACVGLAELPVSFKFLQLKRSLLCSSVKRAQSWAIRVVALPWWGQDREWG